MVTGENSKVRYGALALVCIGIFAALFARLWYLQVMNAPAYSQVAEATATRTLVLPAPRGRILDRNGNVLIDNKPTKVVAIDRQAMALVTDSDAVLSRLATLLNRYQKPTKPFTLKSIKRTLEINRVGPYDPVPLVSDVDERLLVYITEHRGDFPGIVAETRLLRQYHYGTLGAQMLGRVGPISEKAWKAHAKDADPYQKDAQVGVGGTEQSFETYLRGKDGTRVVEVTPSGRIVRTVSRTEPEPGDDVELTIDINAQAAAEQSLVSQVEATRQSEGNPPVPGAAALLMKPETGQILAMASYPSYDPNTLVPTITQAQWDAMNADSAHAPLLNRVDGGLYSPGSTFKLVTALAGLKAGIVTPASYYNDTGSIPIDGCTGEYCSLTNDAGDGALGMIALPTALTKSSNVYFFNIGQLLWLKRSTFGPNALQDTANELGFGKMSGIDLPDENALVMPTQARMQKLHKENPKAFPDATGWYTGTNMNVAIGQGDVQVTPLQLANAYAQFANGGDRFQPTLLYRVLKPFTVPKPTASDVLVESKPVKIGHIDIPADWHAAMLAGFAGVTRDGTASAQFQGFPQDTFPVAGKTGTAQTGTDSISGKQNFSDAFFVGFGPTSKPAYVGVAMLQKAGYGAAAAAPVVRAMLEPLAGGGTWPKVNPTIPFVAPPATPTITTTTTVPGTVSPADGSTEGTVQEPAQTTETTTAGPVAEGN